MTNAVPTKMTREQLKQLGEWKEAAEREVEELTARLGKLTEQLTSAKERCDLIKRLMHLSENKGQAKGHFIEGHFIASTQSQKSEKSKQPFSPSERILMLQSESTNIMELELRMMGILREAGEPMHIRAIREILIERGVPLPGRGDEANVILKLRRAKNLFVRTGRGMYGLVSWGLAEVRPQKRKKRSVRRKRTKS